MKITVSDLCKCCEGFGYFSGDTIPPDHRAEIAALRAEVGRLRGALVPFAHFAEVWNVKPPSGLDDAIHSVSLLGGEATLRVSDCERARRALTEGKK